MNIAIIGATGNVGSRLLEEALRRGHSVTAIARDTAKIGSRDHVTAKSVDLHDAAALAKALAGHDAVISSARFATVAEQDIAGPVRQAGVPRLLVVGGAGSLEVAPGLALVDTPELPEAYKEEALAGKTFLDALRQEQDLDWTFLSPSAAFEPGERTGNFRTGTDTLLIDADGKSRISMEDFAIAMLDELERPAHNRSRFTVGY